MKRFKWIFLFALCILCSRSSLAGAETIRLNSGQIVQGQVVEETPKLLRVDAGIGVTLTFYRDEIAAVEEDAAPAGDGEALAGEEPVDVQPDSGKSFLWTVSDDGHDLYVFGSIHLGKKSMYPLKDVIEDAFEAADTLVVEVNTSGIPEEQARQQMLAKGMYPPGDGLDKNLSRDVLIALRKYLYAHGMDVMQFNNFKPWFVGLTLSVLQVRELGFEEDYGVDLYFLKRANDAGKRVDELETLGQQLQFLDDIPNQDRFLEYSLYTLEETQRMLKDLLAAWNSGNAPEMEKLMITDILAENPDLEPVYEKILFERNAMMAEKIGQYVKDKDRTCFVVVGAGHLVGPRGLIQMLKDKGFTIEQR